MNKSESIGNLAKALSVMQGEIRDVYKDKRGYGYNYADLSQVLETVRPLLAKHRLAVSQLGHSHDDKLALETVLMHESGQWISSVLEIPIERGKGMSAAQAVGSVMSYARRYGLAAILGVAQTDNDASLHVEEKKSVYDELIALTNEKGISEETMNKWCEWANVSDLKDASDEQLNKLIEKIKG